MPSNDLPQSPEFEAALAALVAQHAPPVDNAIKKAADAFPKFVIVDGRMGVDESVNVSNGFETKGGHCLRKIQDGVWLVRVGVSELVCHEPWVAWGNHDAGS